MNVANPTLGDMVRGGAAAKPWVPPKWLNRIARHPAIRLAFLLKEADADIEQIISNPGNQAALALLNHPTAQQIIADNHLLYGQQKGLAGLASLFTAGKYGIKFEASELLPGLSDTLSIAAGYPIDAGTLTPEEALAILDSYAAKMAAKSEVTAENVRVVARTGDQPPDPCDELCEIACQCLTGRGASRTYQQCVADELRKRHYSGGRPGPNGPRPEVSYKPDANGTYQPVMSKNAPEFPTNAPVVPGAPRPDVSWFKDGKLWKIFEMKFPGDGHTPAQSSGKYKEIAVDQGSEFQELDVGKQCDCKTGKAKPGTC
jgi:hypothetical protein